MMALEAENGTSTSLPIGNITASAKEETWYKRCDSSAKTGLEQRKELGSVKRRLCTVNQKHYW